VNTYGFDRHSSLFGHHPDSVFDSRLLAKTLDRPENSTRTMGWRLRLMVLAALFGCLSLLGVTRWLTSNNHIAAQWLSTQGGQLALASTTEPQLQAMVGRTLVAISGPEVNVTELDAMVLQRSSRWLPHNAQRQYLEIVHEQLSLALAQPQVTLTFEPEAQVSLSLAPRHWRNLGIGFWLLSSLALALYTVSMVVLLARPCTRTVLFAIMSFCQSANLVCMAIESTLSLGLPSPFYALNWPLRVTLDFITCAAVVHLVAYHPRRWNFSPWIAGCGWTLMACLTLLMVQEQVAYLWWWAQSSMALMGVLTLWVLGKSYQLHQHPFSMVMRRFTAVVLGTWVLLTGAVALAGVAQTPSLQQQISAIGPVVWYVFLSLLLLLSSMLSKSQQIMREFSLLAATSTVATALDIVFVVVFSFGQFASVTLALFISLGIYAGMRQWLLNRVRSGNMVTTERMFETLYRIAREVEAHPDRTPVLFSQLLRELFNPMEVLIVQKKSPRVRVVGDGSTLLVPIPNLSTAPDTQHPATIVLRYAHRGQSLFTSEDARLTGRIADQLCRAILFDKAVEQGRSEERLRLAQDLHDDIGARLLTLMYKAQSSEMEEYLRHTLQDLKTLTRGLAAANRPLSHAVGEWKADLSQRLSAAQITLGWNLTFDSDILLSVVQWSALTRIIRELVSNVIAHAQARRVDIEFHLARDQLKLSVTDNGEGHTPHDWAHGLGLGGVRKRVKQLGGEVVWREATPCGICCFVVIKQFSQRE
jgi:signal transduction histidine kinase